MIRRIGDQRRHHDYTGGCMSFSRPRKLAARVAVGGTAVLLLATTAAAASRRLHDPKLDLADAAVQKAVASLQSTSCDLINDQNVKECEKAVARALADLSDAREEIAAAVAAQD
jgi:hypothetical protein